MSGRPAGKKVSDMNYQTSYYLMRVLGIVGILEMLIGGLTNQLADYDVFYAAHHND